MTNYVLLDNNTHASIKVDTHYRVAYGDNITSTLTFPTEFSNIQREYPILFHKNADTQRYQAIALLGLCSHENLFLTETAPHIPYPGSWMASYVPATMARGPFVIGMHGDEDNPQPMVHIDTDSPRLSETNGQALFLPQGGNSDYLNRISQVLATIMDGMELSNSMFEAFEHFGLIAPLTVDITLNNGDKLQIGGHYTICEETLNGLSHSQLGELHRQGFLQAAFLVVASMGNLGKLIEMKNARLQD